MTISLPTNKFDWDHNAVFASDVLRQVRSLPSISDAAVVHGIPMREGSYLSDGQGTIEGHVPANEADEPKYGIRVVSPGYLATIQTPIVAGRAFEARDEQRGAACSFLVSDSIARRSRKGRDPLGRRMSFGEALGDWPMVVVGVVGEVRYSGLETCPTVDVNLPQGLFPQSAITLIARRGAVSAGAHSRRGPACFRDGHTLHGSIDRRVVSPAPCEHALCFGVRLDSPSLGRGRRL